MVEGAAKLLFSVPARHDAAFASHVQSFLPPDSHPLLYRGKNVFFMPDAATIQRFDISVRQCGVGEFVLLDNNVWHCGVNLGPNCSISVNILGAGGIQALQQDVRAILDDVNEQRRRMIDFHDDWTAGRLDRSEEEWRVNWSAATKHLQKQVDIYNGTPHNRTAPKHSLTSNNIAAEHAVIVQQQLNTARRFVLPKLPYPRNSPPHSSAVLCLLRPLMLCCDGACLLLSALRGASCYQGGRAFNLLSDGALFPPLSLPATASVPPNHSFFTEPLRLHCPHMQQLRATLEARGDRLGTHCCPERLVGGTGQ